MTIKSLPILVIFFFLISCKENISTEVLDSDFTTIIIPEDLSGMDVSWEDISELEEVVILETTQECLISNIDKIQFHDKRFYVVDRKAKSIFIFSEKGNYIEKIDRQGSGPGEYRELRDFDIDQDGNIHILDYRKILVFDQDLDFQKYIHLEEEYENDLFSPLKMTIDANQDYYLWQGSFGMKEIPKNNTKKAMFKVSKEGRILDSFIGFNVATTNNLRFFDGPDQIINITPEKRSDTIYSIENSQFKPRFFMDFGNKSLSQLKDSEENSYGKIRNILETNDHLYFNFSDGKNIFVGLYSKNDGKLVVDGLKFGKDYSLGPVIGGYDDYLISAVDSYIVSMTIDTIISNVTNKENRDKLQVLRGLERENNPVLFVHKIPSEVHFEN